LRRRRRCCTIATGDALANLTTNDGLAQLL
jgi:hypothetical protein